MRASIMIAMAALSACGDNKDAAQDTGESTIDEPSAPDAPAPWDYDGGASPAVYDQDAFEDTVNAAFRDVMTISGAPPILGYWAMMAEADEEEVIGGCPQYYEYGGSSYWAGSCTAVSGAGFDGYVFAEVYENAEVLGPGSAMSGFSINGQAILTDGDGSRLDLSGYTYDAAGTINSGDTPAWMTAVYGAFSWNDEVVAETWLGGPLQPTLDATAFQYTLDGDGNTAQIVNLTGGLGGLDASWSTAYLEGIYMVNEVPGFWECGLEPTGIISARSSDHHWYQLVFDVEEQESGVFTTPPGLCDGCGTVYRAGVEVGEACVDVSPLIDWEDQPW